MLILIGKGHIMFKPELVTIVDNFGNEINMGTEFDCFKDTANTNYYELNNINDEIRNNRRLLYNAMLQAGFTNLPTEWWHFEQI